MLFLHLLGKNIRKQHEVYTFARMLKVSHMCLFRKNINVLGAILKQAIAKSLKKIEVTQFPVNCILLLIGDFTIQWKKSAIQIEFGIKRFFSPTAGELFHGTFKVRRAVKLTIKLVVYRRTGSDSCHFQLVANKYYRNVLSTRYYFIVNIDSGAVASLRRALSRREALWPVAHPYSPLQSRLYHPLWISTCVTKGHCFQSPELLVSFEHRRSWRTDFEMFFRYLIWPHYTIF
jgi:hypothetical protein